MTKAKQICHSHQYSLLVPFKGGNNLVNYIKQIWTVWFFILYTFGGTGFFEDKFASDNYHWKYGANPFFELEKYDIFHWGLSQKFRSIGLGVCYDIANSNYYPKPPKPPIGFLRTNSYKNMGHTSAPNRDSISFWSPISVEYEGEYYYPIMQVGLKNNDYEKDPKKRLETKYYKELLSNKTVKNGLTIRKDIGNLRVELYSYSNQRGNSKKFDIGKFPNIGVYNITKIQNGSYRVPDEFKLILYTEENYEGASKVIVGPKTGNFIDLDFVNESASTMNENYFKSCKVEYTSIGDGPDKEALLVTGSTKYIKPPIGYDKIWTSTGVNGVYFWVHKHGDSGPVGHWNKT